MKTIGEKVKIFFCGILFFTFMIPFASVKSQTNFVRNDSFDFEGVHEFIAAYDPNNNNVKYFINSDSDFPLFKLHILKNRLNLISPTGPWIVVHYKVVIDGNTVQDWTSADEMTISHSFPSPSGISANHTFSFQIDYDDDGAHRIGTFSGDVSVTIFAKPRVFVDANNNSFVQLRDEDCTNKIPMLMVEGFDPLNQKFPETYYNLTWDLVNMDLYPNGYEVFILNFNDGGRDLRQNADVVLKALDKIHEVCPNYAIALGGLSMGGPIGRYAFSKKGKSGWNNKRWIISFLRFAADVGTCESQSAGLDI